MKEVRGDLWAYYNAGGWIVIPTNGSVNVKGLAVMGRGVALQAAKKFPPLKEEEDPGIQSVLGDRLRLVGNIPFILYRYEVLTFPVKHRWSDERADPNLIVQSAQRLKDLVDTAGLTEIFLPCVGCGNGRLSWLFIKPRVEPFMDSRFTVVHYENVKKP